MIFTAHGDLPVTLFSTASTRRGCMSDEEIAAFLEACEVFLTKNRPDVVWTYGGDRVSLAVQKLVKRLDIPLLFALHNFTYSRGESFAAADYVAVPAEFARQHYWNSMGLASLVLPPVVDWGRVEVAKSIKGPKEPRHEESPHPNRLPEGEGTVTFVNPQRTKGLYVFVRIAEVLAARRPDIPLLVVEGRSGSGWRNEKGINLARLPNVTVWPNTADVRLFYAASRLLIMPSLWNESFGLVAAEAMINGIPVLASNRGRCRRRSATPASSSRSPPVTRPRPATCPRRRKWNLGWRRSYGFGTTRPSTSAGAALRGSVPSDGGPSVLRRFTASSSVRSRTSPGRRLCRGWDRLRAAKERPKNNIPISEGYSPWLISRLAQLASLWSRATA